MIDINEVLALLMTRQLGLCFMQLSRGHLMLTKADANELSISVAPVN